MGHGTIFSCACNATNCIACAQKNCTVEPYLNCTKIQGLWEKLQLKLMNNITLLPLTSTCFAFFGFLEVDCQSYALQNHILLSFILYIYKPRKGKFLSDICLLKQMNKVRRVDGWLTSISLCENECI